MQQMALNVYQGDSYHWQFSLFTDAAGTVPYDLTDVTPKAEIRVRTGAPVLAQLGCTVTLPNVIDVDLDADESGKLLLGLSTWDLQLTTAGSPPRVKTVLAGPVSVTGDVTDSTRP